MNSSSSCQIQLIEFIIINVGRTLVANHPMHLHGHHFWVVGWGKIGETTTLDEFKKLDKEGKIKRYLDSPPRKDTGKRIWSLEVTRDRNEIYKFVYSVYYTVYTTKSYSPSCFCPSICHCYHFWHILTPFRAHQEKKTHHGTTDRRAGTASYRVANSPLKSSRKLSWTR